MFYPHYRLKPHVIMLPRQLSMLGTNLQCNTRTHGFIPGWVLHTELVFTCFSGLVALHCLSLPGFVPSLPSCLGGLVGRVPAW